MDLHNKVKYKDLKRIKNLKRVNTIIFNLLLEQSTLYPNETYMNFISTIHDEIETDNYLNFNSSDLLIFIIQNF